MHDFTFKQTLLSILAVFSVSTCTVAFAEVPATQFTVLQQKLKALEASSGGRIGISAIDTSNNQRIQYRAEERFPVQSTFKVMGVAAVLQQSITNKQLLQQKVTYNKRDVVFWSPITTKYLAGGVGEMTISDLCAAAIQFSDNTAINLLMKKLGGPKVVTSFARSIGDRQFRLNGWEPKLNSNPKDLHDTSTPTAMENSLQQLIFGDALASSVQREQLVTWMKGNTTGDARIRAGVPTKAWVVADKTGSGDYGITNDIGIIWPPQCAPIVVAFYFVQNQKQAAQREDIIASATRLLINEFATTDACIKRQI